MKKGIFTPTLVLLTLFLLGYTVFVFHISETNDNVEYLGKKQMDLFNVYQEGENSLFELDLSARYSSIKTLYELAESGGFLSQLDCGVRDDYVLWMYGSVDCYPSSTDLENSFWNRFRENLNGSLLSYGVDLSSEDFDLSFAESENLVIIGTAKKPLIIEKENITYSIVPNFKSELDHNFEDYYEIIEDVKSIVEKCNETVSCWNDEIEDNWEMEENGKIFKFKVNTGKKIWINKGEVIIKFGLDFNPYNPLFV